MLNLIDLIQRLGVGQQGSPGGFTQPPGTPMSSFPPSDWKGWGRGGNGQGLDRLLSVLMKKKKRSIFDPLIDDEEEIPYIYEWINTSPEGGAAPEGGSPDAGGGIAGPDVG